MRLRIADFGFWVFIGGALFMVAMSLRAEEGVVVYEGQSGPGKGKHIVFLAGDEEYRSEEGLPMLAKILAVRHGFKCTVAFSINPADGTIDPLNQTNMPGLGALDHADMMVLQLRFRDPGEKMKHIVDFLNSGKPIMGLRTATHSFQIKDPKSPYAKYDWRNKEWPGGFGQQVLGDTWVNHHGNHGQESTRGVIVPEMKDHPVLRGVEDIWGPTDVYGVPHVPPDAKVLVRGQVLAGMKPTDKPVAGPKNEPMMPLVWLREYKGEAGKTPQAVSTTKSGAPMGTTIITDDPELTAKSSKVICTTMGAAVDLESEGLRRLLVNACYWALGLENKIPAKADVSYVGEYKPSSFGFGKFIKGVKPADLALPPAAK
jgi:hypothetical protein